MEIITQSASETFELGQKIGNYLIKSGSRANCIIGLTGELGSGKTILIQGLARSLGIMHLVPSPTFIIVRQYIIQVNGFEHFYHLDLYRVAKKADLASLGLNEILTDPNSIIAVEWAEKLEDLGHKMLKISFQIKEGEKRLITLNRNIWKTT